MLSTSYPKQPKTTKTMRTLRMEYEFSEADFTKEEAKAVLVADEAFTEADATYVLDVLYRRGHVYYVDEEVYITPTDD
ncbi:hypothetical protein C447_00270 [Halococcus hamelinensis 100A6]|uniref:Uncharacterized protein n=2 Tax=Halococcus hamelinensis TaxID=332168 RepID=M0M9G6_9EURY|nr:hypothetical protein C447_00270 [Halococcus hamelinensis 100A6]